MVPRSYILRSLACIATAVQATTLLQRRNTADGTIAIQYAGAGGSHHMAEIDVVVPTEELQPGDYVVYDGDDFMHRGKGNSDKGMLGYVFGNQNLWKSELLKHLAKNNRDFAESGLKKICWEIKAVRDLPNHNPILRSSMIERWEELGAKELTLRSDPFSAHSNKWNHFPLQAIHVPRVFGWKKVSKEECRHWGGKVPGPIVPVQPIKPSEEEQSTIFGKIHAKHAVFAVDASGSMSASVGAHGAKRRQTRLEVALTEVERTLEKELQHGQHGSSSSPTSSSSTSTRSSSSLQYGKSSSSSTSSSHHSPLSYSMFLWGSQTPVFVDKNFGKEHVFSGSNINDFDVFKNELGKLKNKDLGLTEYEEALEQALSEAEKHQKLQYQHNGTGTDINIENQGNVDVFFLTDGDMVPRSLKERMNSFIKKFEDQRCNVHVIHVADDAVAICNFEGKETQELLEKLGKETGGSYRLVTKEDFA